MAVARRRLGNSDESSRRVIRRSRSSRNRSGSRTATSTPRPDFQQESIWHSPGSRKTAGPRSPAKPPASWCCSCAAQVGQPQLSVSLASQASSMASIRELQIWIAEHLTANLSIQALANRMAVSVRHFERVFTREVGTMPSQFVLGMRVESARRQLERTDNGLKQVAATSGFSGVDVMSRAFVRLLGVTPRRYRELATE